MLSERPASRGVVPIAQLGIEGHGLEDIHREHGSQHIGIYFTLAMGFQELVDGILDRLSHQLEDAEELGDIHALPALEPDLLTRIQDFVVFMHSFGEVWRTIA